ncbi:cadherin-like domain-containing protein [Xanthobacter oligotrophicus]|uniref:Cadherin-like domain-containing protein n=1 Tax=Xanthobacter oligotrophicus TaxID=2607286 RepID=A0ABW7A1F0_9HYPH
MIIVKGTRAGGAQRTPAEIYRTHDEKPGGRVAALFSAGLAGALAFLAAGTTGAEAKPEPPPGPEPPRGEPEAPSPEASPASAAAAEEDPPAGETDEPAMPRLPETASFADAPMLPDMPGSLGRSGAAMRQPSDDMPPLPAPWPGRAEADGPAPRKAMPAPAAGGGGGGGGGGGPSARSEADEEGDDDTSRNRPPRVGDPVTLPNVSVAQAVFIPLAALLAGASDPEGQALDVQKLVVSSGMLVPTKGGWVYLAPPAAAERVTLSYVVSDGIAGVPQHAVFEIDPDGIEASRLDLPSATFAALPAASRDEPADPDADPAEHALADPALSGLAAVVARANHPDSGSAGAATIDAPATETPAADTVSSATVLAEAAPAAETAAAASGGDIAAATTGDSAFGATTTAIETAPATPMEVATAPTMIDQPVPDPTLMAASAEIDTAPADSASADTAAATALAQARTDAEADSFVFAAAPPDTSPQSVSQIVDLQVGDKLQVKDSPLSDAPSPPTGDPDQLFAETYGDGSDTRPYAFQAEATPLSAAAPADALPASDVADAGTPLPTPDALALA